MNRLARTFVPLLTAVSLAACGGGGSAPGIPGGSPPPGGGTAAVSFSITIPAEPSGSLIKRRPDYVSSNTQSVTVSVNGGARQAIGLTPSTNPNCTGNGVTTPITCLNLTVSALPGTDVFTFNLYQDPLVGGKEPPNPTLLSTYTSPPKTIVAGSNNQLGVFTLNPVVHSVTIAISLPSGNFPVGSTGCFPISINAVDASGATIIGDAPYVDFNGDPLGIVVGTDLAAPYSSGFTFAAGACSASGSSTFTFTTPGQTAGMMSLGVIHPVFHITAIGNAVINTKLTIPPATGVLSMSLTCAQPLDVCSNGIPPSVSFVAVNNTATITLSEPGWTNPPFSQGLALSGDTCNQNDSPGAQGNWAVFTPGKGGVASTFSVKATGVGTPKAPSTCAATFIDPLGAHITMSIQVTASSIGVQ